MATKTKAILCVGKRKTAVARASVSAGKGAVRINHVPLDNLNSRLMRMKVMEALSICSPASGKFDFDVIVEGGGVNGQTDASRQAIVKGLLEATKDKHLKQRVLAYDRSMIVYDSRRTEPHKPSRSSKGARRKRQLSKR